VEQDRQFEVRGGEQLAAPLAGTGWGAERDHRQRAAVGPLRNRTSQSRRDDRVGGHWKVGPVLLEGADREDDRATRSGQLTELSPTQFTGGTNQASGLPFSLALVAGRRPPRPPRLRFANRSPIFS